MLSIGTGAPPIQDVRKKPRSLVAWGQTILELATESERIHKNVERYVILCNTPVIHLLRWRQVTKGVEQDAEDTGGRSDKKATFDYIRLNPPELGKFSLDDYTSVDTIASHTAM